MNDRPSPLPPSDHFDGRRFFNPGVTAFPGYREIFRLLRSRTREPWAIPLPPMPARLPASVGPNEAAITFVGHSTFLIQLPGLNLLTDPIWSERASPFSFAGPKRQQQPGIALEQLPRIDAILLSHNHYDHMDMATLQALAPHRAPIITPLGNRTYLEKAGIGGAVELDWWQSTELPGGARVTITPAQHFCARGLFDRFCALWGSHVIEYRGARIFFAGDTGYAGHFREIHHRLGAPDIAMLPIGAYEPRWFMKVVHTDPAEAVQAHRKLGARHSIGMHFGTFPLTGESPQTVLRALAAARRDQGVSEEEFGVLREGETALLPTGPAARPALSPAGADAEA